MSIPAIVLNSSPDIWEGVPIPADAMLTLRGLAFAKAINSGTVLAGNDGVHHHHVRRSGDACNRHNIADEIEVELFVQCRVDYIRRSEQQERIAVRCRARDRFGSDIATGARAVLDDELLAKAFRQPFTHETCEDVSRTASLKADDQAHRPRRVDLCPGGARQHRRGNACCEMQEMSPVGKFHCILLPDRFYYTRVNGRGRAMRE